MAQIAHMNFIKPSNDKAFKPNPDTGIYELVDDEYESEKSSYVF